ncbi:penicillin-binding transpeptidase domain-containing protein [Oceanobacillus halotolerans]|uniref:penicillin-binding transpeptidase domain-containing protein n=1 Tax=Oceanobacillus halotolerans TaxID=2663380 RepID=UPI0013DC7B6D|nr:penicillin-binding transpeptidase domain-containing protein [Oceanobacillus halotolerans]
MKRISLWLSITLITFITACSDDEVTPNERFNTYVDQWNEQNYSEMYEMLSSEATETYATEDYVDRYEKIYGDLEVSDLEVSFEELSEEQTETALEEGTATIPFSVSMSTLAGPIDFDYEATLTQQGEEEEKNWFVEWDPGFIFPELKDGGEITFQTTAPERGEILDRNRMPLAMNDIVYEIGVVPGEMTNPDQTIEKLADLLKMSVDSIEGALNQEWVGPDLFVPLSEVPQTNEEVLNQLWEIDGVLGNEVTGRIYPHGEIAAHLTGYVGPITAEELEEQEPGTYSSNDVIGKRGLEQLYEKELKGQQGVQIIVTKEDEEAEDVVLAEKPVKDGENIMLTIDIEVQEEIFNSYDGEAGTAAAINPKTGETLALVSSPSFNPNDVVYGMTASEWEDLQEDEQTPLINRFSATFAPGSTIKPVTAAIGLNNGTIDPDEGIEIEGLTWNNGDAWGDYEVRRVSESSGPVDLHNALVRSDNIYFAMQGVEMGADAFVDGMEQFGFGEDMPFEYPLETSNVSSDGAISDEVMLANASYGQGQLEMTALHLATSYTPFLNEGNMLQPILRTDEETSQVWKSDLLTSDQAAIIQEALRDVVAASNGTAKAAQNADFAISGKTGTAELKLTSDEEDGQENGWFVAYPTDDQDVLIAMMVEGVEDNGGSGYVVDKVTNVLQAIK